MPSLNTQLLHVFHVLGATSTIGPWFFKKLMGSFLKDSQSKISRATWHLCAHCLRGTWFGQWRKSS